MRQPSPYYSTARFVREYFGLAQAELAGFLDVTRGLLAAAETGRRELPPAALLRLAVLAQAIAPAQAAVVPAPATSSSAELLPVTLFPVLRPLQARRAACLLAADRLRQAAAPLMLKAERARRLRALLPTLEAALAPLPADERPRRWLALLAESTAHTLSLAADARRARLAAREAGLRAEAEWIRGYIEGIAANDVPF